MLRMTIEGVSFDHLRQTVVVLKDWDGQKLLPIWIGPSEAKSIAIELEGARPPRPLSHDLLLNCLQLIGGRVTRVVINDLQDSTFFATIDIDTPQGMKHIDSRPSDAIAVAVRAKCPVFADGGALDALIEVSEIASAAAVAMSTGDTGEFVSDDNSESSESASSPDPDDSGAPSDEINRFKRLIGDLEL